MFDQLCIISFFHPFRSKPLFFLLASEQFSTEFFVHIFSNSQLSDSRIYGVFVGQGVRVGPTVGATSGAVVRVGMAVKVREGSGVCEANIAGAVREATGVEVTVPVRLSRPKAMNAARAARARTPASAPNNQGSQPARFFAGPGSKSGGTAIRMTVMLSCPPRSFARSTRARVASLTFDFKRTISRISSFHTRSVRPSLHI